MSQALRDAFAVPDRIRPLRERVLRFVEDEVYPVESQLLRGGKASWPTLERLQERAKEGGLWALGHPEHMGGQGLSMLDYAYINEVIGRSEAAIDALGTVSLHTAMMIDLHATPEQRRKFLEPIVDGTIKGCFAVTEPEVPGSDPTALRTTARLEGDEWVIDGHKWFTSGAHRPGYTIVMARTEEDEGLDPHRRFSMIIVPHGTPGLDLVREMVVLGLDTVLSGHWEVRYDEVRVPKDNLLGGRGEGFVLAQERLGPGRIFHCMRWLGQAQRAFDFLCQRAVSRESSGEPLSEKQLVQQMIFDSYSEIWANRLMVLDTARRIQEGDQARTEVSAIKVQTARMVHNVVDRAMQIHGAAGLTQDYPLEIMYRAARYGRIVDGPDEIHIARVGKRLAREYQKGKTWDFGLR